MYVVTRTISFFIQTLEWRYQFCLHDSLDQTRCLSILCWIRACEQAGSRDFAFMAAVEISSLRLRTVGMVLDGDIFRDAQSSQDTRR